ncbi:MAG: menaquinol-cytochrome c reductase cytochrome b/c subunit [Chloroflexota bacterium]|nr:menaquinol-cytochrome c reductase cytochrome b/c subunit [Chloroflexota bacterium]
MADESDATPSPDTSNVPGREPEAEAAAKAEGVAGPDTTTPAARPSAAATPTGVGADAPRPAGAAGGAAAAVATRPVAAPAARPAAPASLKKDADSSIPSYPALVYREFISALVVGVVLTVISLVVQSPLQQQADPSMTPDPSKAPWYFLGLQELLSRVPPITAGVAFPTFVIVGLIVMPYLDRNPSRQPRDRKVGIILFTTFVVFSVAFALIGTFFRGLEWRWFWTGILGR